MGTWLHSLELQGYQELFEAAGYKTRDDLENLKGLKRMDLQKMGISKRGRNKKNHSLVTSHTLPLAHLHRFEEGILRLSYLYDAKFRLMPEVVTWLEQHDCTVSLKSLTRALVLLLRLETRQITALLFPSAMHHALSKRATPVCYSSQG